MQFWLPLLQKEKVMKKYFLMAAGVVLLLILVVYQTRIKPDKRGSIASQTAIAELNGDGEPDKIVAKHKALTKRDDCLEYFLYVSTPLGDHEVKKIHQSKFSKNPRLEVKDYDNDQDNDLVISGVLEKGFILCLNDGKGNFTFSHRVVQNLRSKRRNIQKISKRRKG